MNPHKILTTNVLKVIILKRESDFCQQYRWQKVKL